MILRRTFLTLPFAGVALSSIRSRSVKVETIFRSPGPKPNGMQAVKEGLWILDQGDNRAYLVDYKHGRVLRKLETDSKAGSGITFDGKALWLASTYSREIIQADATTGKTLAKYPCPGSAPVNWPNPRKSPLAPRDPPRKAGATPPADLPTQRQSTGAHGLEWRDGRLWIAVPPAQTIYKVNPDGFKIEKQFKTAGDRPHGLGWEGKFLWCADSNENAFHRYDPESGEVLEKIQLTDSDPLPHGMTIWKRTMYYCDDVGVVCKLIL